MFSREEALQFLQDTLKVHDVETKLKTDRRSLLEEIVINMQSHVPFNNLRLLSVPLEERHRPTLQEIKEDLVSGIGGLCYNMNVGLYFILKALGFNSSVAISGVTVTSATTRDHAVCYIADVEKQGDRFFAEVGIGFPTLRVIDLSFEVESPEYFDSYIEYKYVKHEGQLLRMQRRGCPMIAMGSLGEGDFYLGDWRRTYWASLDSTLPVEDYDEDFDKVFTDPNVTPFHHVIRLMGCPGGKGFGVKMRSFFVENDDRALTKKDIEGGDDGIVSTIRKVYPAIPEQLIRDALKHVD